MSDQMLMNVWVWIFRKLLGRGYCAWLEVDGRWICPAKFTISMGKPQPPRLDCTQTPKQTSEVQP